MEGMCTKHILWPMYHEKHMPVVVINIYALHGWSGTWWTMWRGLAASSMSLGGDSRTSFRWYHSSIFSLTVAMCQKLEQGERLPSCPIQMIKIVGGQCNWNLYPQYCRLYAMAGFYILGPLFAWFEYVCMCKCSHVCCGFLIVSVFAKVFPNARGWTFPSERWKQLGSKSRYDGPQDGGVGLGDGCFMIFCVHESDLLGFMKIYVALLSLSIRYVEMSWDILYIWELGGLCCVVGWNVRVSFSRSS